MAGIWFMANSWLSWASCPMLPVHLDASNLDAVDSNITKNRNY